MREKFVEAASGTRACAKSRAARTGGRPRRTAGSWRRGPRGRRRAHAARPKPAAPPGAADARMPNARGTGTKRRGGAAPRSAPPQSRRRLAAPADRGRGRPREGYREPAQCAAPASRCRQRRHGRGAEPTWPAASRGAAEPCGRSLAPPLLWTTGRQRDRVTLPGRRLSARPSCGGGEKGHVYTRLPPTRPPRT